MMMAFLISLFAFTSSANEGPLSCAFRSGDETVRLELTNLREALVTIKSKAVRRSCRMRVTWVDDSRDGLTSMVRVIMRPMDGCHPFDAAFEKTLAREIVLQVGLSANKLVGKFSFYRALGYEDCELKNYSPQVLGLPVQK